MSSLPPQQPSFSDHMRYHWARSQGTLSLIIIYVCVAFYLAVILLKLLGVLRGPHAWLYFGLSYPGIFHNGWVHQFVTSPFLHRDLLHLVFNMLALWMFGPYLEGIFGRRRYVIFSLICAASAMAGFLLFSAITGERSAALGYSGVIFGIFTAAAVIEPNAPVYVFYFFCLKRKHAVYLFCAMEFLLVVAPEDHGVAHIGHLAGALAAYLFMRGRQLWQTARTRMQARTKRRARRKRLKRPDTDQTPWKL